MYFWGVAFQVGLVFFLCASFANCSSINIGPNDMNSRSESNSHYWEMFPNSRSDSPSLGSRPNSPLGDRGLSRSRSRTNVDSPYESRYHLRGDESSLLPPSIGGPLSQLLQEMASQQDQEPPNDEDEDIELPIHRNSHRRHTIATSSSDKEPELVFKTDWDSVSHEEDDFRNDEENRKDKVSHAEPPLPRKACLRIDEPQHASFPLREPYSFEPSLHRPTVPFVGPWISLRPTISNQNNTSKIITEEEMNEVRIFVEMNPKKPIASPGKSKKLGGH